MSSIAEVFCHLSEYARHPLSMGALTPGSRSLAAAMTAIVPSVAPGDTILELGPGTGSITRDIRVAWPDHRVVAVEKNARLAARLHARYPDVEVVHGCVTDILAANETRIGLIMSSLPMLSFDDAFRERVLAAIDRALPRRAYFVQYTYSGRVWRRWAPRGFRLVASHRVLRNFPPATILCFQKAR